MAKLITTRIKEILKEEQKNYSWDEYSNHLFDDLYKELEELRQVELNNIYAAFIDGNFTQSRRYHCRLDCNDHVHNRYNEEWLNEVEVFDERKSIAFWEKVDAEGGNNE